MVETLRIGEKINKIKSFVEIPSINVIPLKVVFFSKERNEKGKIGRKSFRVFCPFNITLMVQKWSEKTSCKRDVLIFNITLSLILNRNFQEKLRCRNTKKNKKETLKFRFVSHPLSHQQKKKKKKKNKYFTRQISSTHFYNFKNQNQQD